MRQKNTISFQELNNADSVFAGGKGANLGRLFSFEGINVPDGFVITTNVYETLIQENTELARLLHELAETTVNQLERLSAKLREHIQNMQISEAVVNDIALRLRQFEPQTAFAVRSSSTAEDLPDASFAGQHESFLNVSGLPAIIACVTKCWSSLFTERAISYRLQHGLDHRKVAMAVVIQQMVFPEVSGVLFTADPRTGNRKITSIEAISGLGEALVSGKVSPDIYQISGNEILQKNIGTKTSKTVPSQGIGTKEVLLNAGLRELPALTDTQVIKLGRIGEIIEQLFGSPQDIEWCLANDQFYVVQSRPITTLFPVPNADDDKEHIYVSVGHQQMMTEAIKPLGLSFFLLTTRAPMKTAGGRLFVDITKMLATQSGRQTVISKLGKSDPLISDALNSLMRRKFSVDILPDEEIEKPAFPDRNFINQFKIDCRGSLELAGNNILNKSGNELFEFIIQDLRDTQSLLFNPELLKTITATINASFWLNEKMQQWLGETNAADTITQSVPDNISSEMGLAVMDLADVIRPYSELINFLSNTENDSFVDHLAAFPGGPESASAINNFLQKYGMRCSGEIDITRTRWSEKPLTLIPVILSHIKNVKPGAALEKFRKGRISAFAKEQELLQRLKLLPDGDRKAEDTANCISIIRGFSGFREYPKYCMISKYFIYKKALLREAEILQQKGIIGDREDVFYLSFDELRQLVSDINPDLPDIEKRKKEFKAFSKFVPPRVLTSDGECLNGNYASGNIPEGALQGLPVSSGIVEGRARIIYTIEEADLEPGDIIVTAFTDPGWTPLFLSASALVTEVGGLMTHGAVVAREYGLPAVVGVMNAKTLISDRQPIRVNGTNGYVEIL